MMQPKRRTAGKSGWKSRGLVSLMLIVVVAAVIGGLETTSVEGTSTAAEHPFKHSFHVSASWARASADGIYDFPETQRDCQGCHDFSKPDQAWEEVCISCHIHNVRTDGIQVDKRPKESSFFEHADHPGLECRSCHTPESLLGEGERTVPVPSSSYCGQCHDPSRWSALAAELKPRVEDAHSRFITTLNARMSTARSDTTQNSSRFSHKTHLTEEQLSSDDPTPCLQCHSSMKVAHAKNIHEKQFSTESCAKTCHQGQEIVTEAVPQDSLTAGTFVHFYHLGNLNRPEGEDNHNVEQMLCKTCHELGESQQISVKGRRDEFTLTSFLAHPQTGGDQGPAMCMSCHFHKEWGVPHHGKFDSCQECHDTATGFGGNSNLAQQSNRPHRHRQAPRASRLCRRHP